MSLTYVKASCHCGLNVFQAAFVASELPQSTYMCHCNSCRHITGKLAAHGAVLHGAPLSVNSIADAREPADLSKLAKYNASVEITRYFCSGCGAYMLYELKGEKEIADSTWIVSTGALERTEGIVEVGSHAYISDTLDGGLAEHYQTLDGKQIPRYADHEGGPTLPTGWKAKKLLKKPASEKDMSEERLEAYCHCKNISVHLTRAKPEDAQDPSKWWFVKGDDKDPNSRVRFMAGHDFCTSCRLASGAAVGSWVILPRVNVIDNRTSSPVVFLEGDGNRIPGLKQYQSSPGTFREFCGTCGASAFYWTKNNKSGRAPEKIGDEPTVIDIGVGLFDEDDDGSRAESWCFWYPQVVNAADALDVPGKDSIQETLKKLANADGSVKA